MRQMMRQLMLRMRSGLVGGLGLVAVASVLAVVLAAVTAVAPAQRAQAAGLDNQMASPTYVLKNGVTAPVYSYAKAIRETVEVSAPDGDGDGHADLVTADIIRPRELAASKVPVIMDASPYYLCCGRGNQSQVKTYAADGSPRDFPLFYDNYFVPRGYAIVLVDMAGTGRSTGCADEGGASDISSVKAVIDWLNGRAHGVGLNGKPMRATWATGSVGMIGKSYDGTLADGVAATGVRGLKTIVPISAITSWYDYDRSQGLPFSYNYPTYLSETVESGRTQNVDCSAVNQAMARDDADDTGAFTAFWAARDYRDNPPPDVSKVTASVFVVHGLQDTNVKTVTMGPWLRELTAKGVLTKVWLSRLGHTDPFDYDRAHWVATLHKWFDSQLLGIDNGILKQPRVRVEDSPGHWVQSASWPLATTNAVLHPQPDGSLSTSAGTGSAPLTNKASQSESAALSTGTNPNRLLFRTAPLTAAARVSGQPTVTLSIAPGAASGQVAVALVDYGRAARVVDDGEGNTTLSTSSRWGLSVSYDSACYFNSVEHIATSPYGVIARGWARTTGTAARTMKVDLAYQDVVVPAGDRVGLVVYSASPDWAVVLDKTSDTYRIDLSKTSVRVPLVGTLHLGTAGSAGTDRRAPAPVVAPRHRSDPRLPF